MLLGVIAVTVLAIAAVVELWVYQEAIWWHSDPTADRRNWKPPR